MNSLNTIKRLLNIIIEPQKEWAQIEKDQHTTKEVFTKFTLPVILFASLATFAGSYLIVNSSSINSSIIKVLITLLSFIFSLYFTGVIINQLSAKFGGIKKLSSTLIYLSYAFCVFIITAGIADLHYYLRHFNLIGVYSLYLLWIGAKPILKMPTDKVAGFAIITFLLFAVSHTLFGFIFGLFLFT